MGDPNALGGFAYREDVKGDRRPTLPRATVALMVDGGAGATTTATGRFTRRRLLGGGVALGVSGLAAACGLFDDDGPERFGYGNDPLQFAELWKPTADPPWPVVVMVHGGAWLNGVDRTIMDPVARDLAARSYAVWNIEYRRLGDGGGGWPGTFTDVAAAIDAVAARPEKVPVDPERVILLGHSAGGHLALWGAARPGLPAGAPGGGPLITPRAVMALAPIADLARCADEGTVDGACLQLLGGSPAEVPERYAVASPRQRLPIGVRQRVFHGTSDDVLPIGLSRDYVAAASAAGDDAELIELPFANHFTVLEPDGGAWAEVTSRVGALFL